MADFEMNAPVEDGEAEVKTVSEEDKHARFRAESQDLVRKAIASIKKIEKFSKDRLYSIHAGEVEKMFNAMQKALDDTHRVFEEDKEFSWDD